MAPTKTDFTKAALGSFHPSEAVQVAALGNGGLMQVFADARPESAPDAAPGSAVPAPQI